MRDQQLIKEYDPALFGYYQDAMNLVASHQVYSADTTQTAQTVTANIGTGRLDGEMALDQQAIAGGTAARVLWQQAYFDKLQTEASNRFCGSSILLYSHPTNIIFRSIPNQPVSFTKSRWIGGVISRIDLLNGLIGVTPPPLSRAYGMRSRGQLFSSVLSAQGQPEVDIYERPLTIREKLARYL